MTEKITCIIVDDEPPARELIASYIKQLDYLELCAQFDNALDAFSYLQKKEVKILFLDIQMAGMNGLELIRSLINKPAVILTTAYREFAVDGFDLNALDYLVKPIIFERFLKAVSKYYSYSGLAIAPVAENTENTFENAYMFFKVNKEMVKIYLKDILFIESVRDYIKIITDKTSYITYQRINYLEEKLPENQFVRIHRSYIIATEKIKTFRSDAVRIGSQELPVGRHYRQKFSQYLQQFSKKD